MTDQFPFEPIRPDLDTGYNARASVPSYEAEYARYVAASEAVRAATPPSATLVFDEASGETLDFYAGAPGAPIFLWIHGGYWRALSKDDNAFIVPGLLSHGIGVAVMNYSLAPAVTLDEIARQVRAAVAFLARSAAAHGHQGRRIHVGGSSAGGHLVGMLLAEGWTEAFGLGHDVIGAALALSGLFDLDPLRFTHINQWLRLDAAAAARNSPGRLIPSGSAARLIAAAGGLETEAFRQQTEDYVRAWRQAGNACELVAMPDHNHFNLALSLGEPDGLLARATIGAIAASG